MVLSRYLAIHYNHTQKQFIHKPLNKPAVDFRLLNEHPKMFVVSGPSGVGKDSVLRALIRTGLPLYHVVTANTRKPRQDEKEGIDYFFVSRQDFEGMIARDELIEYSRVYDDYKGIPKVQVTKAMATGKDVIFRLDVQGAEKIKSIYPQAILIFLLPSNEQEWFKRLGGRRLSQEKDLDTRIATVKMELEKAMNFDYLVVNAQNELRKTVEIIKAIITAEHHKPEPHKNKLLEK